MKDHTFSFSSLPFYPWGREQGVGNPQEKSIKRLRSKLRAGKAETAPGDLEGCSLRGCSLTAPLPT